MKQFLLLCFMVVYGWAETLPQLVDYAIKHSTISKQNQTTLDMVALNKQNAQAQMFGELNIVGDYTHYNIERTIIPLVPSIITSGQPVTTSKDILSTGLKYTVPLFTGFAQTKAVEVESIASQMSHAKVKLSLEQLTYNIRSLYLSILAQQEILNAQYSYTKALKKLYEQISYEVSLGKKAKIDKLKASSDLESAKTKEKIIASNIEVTKATLNALVGKSIKNLSPLHIVVKQPHYSVSRLYSKATTLSKIELENMSVQKAQKMVDKSNASKLPQVNLAIYAGKNYGQDIATNSWDDETLWQAGVNVSYNLIDFGKRDISTQKAKISKIQAKLKKEQTLLDLKKLLTQGIEKIKQNYAEYRGNLAQLKLSKKSQEIEQLRYDNDTVTLNDLLLAKGKTWLAQAKVIESRYNYQKSKYYIDFLMEQGVR